MSAQTEIHKIKVTRIFRETRITKSRYVINVGGARSSKSYSIAQLLIERLFTCKNRKILVVRKTFPALRLTAYKVIVDILKTYGVYSRVTHNRTEHIISYGANSITFVSVDDPQKIKSTEWNDIWIEEANELTWDDFMVLETRLSGPTVPGEPNQIYLSLNPDEETGWIKQRLIDNARYIKENKIRVIHSTFKDNPFLDNNYIEILKDLKEQDPDYWRIFGLGEWGVLKNIIYPPYRITNDWPEEFDETYYGLDFGFNHQTAMLRVDERDGEAYLKEELYKTHLTTPDLIGELSGIIPPEYRERPIYADSAEAAAIKQIYDAGFNIHPAIKDVKPGILFCKHKKTYVHPDSVNLIEERKTYKWKKDKDGKILDEPVKFKDHLMDAIRYALYTHSIKAGAGPVVTVIN